MRPRGASTVRILPTDGPLVLNLELAEPIPDGGTFPARILAPDGRAFETRGEPAGGGLRFARVELQADWLTPGRYIVELKTTELSHFPLRRYALVVH